MDIAITSPLRLPAPHRPGLWRFVLLSLLLHLGLLWGLQQGREPFPAPAVSQQAHSMTIHLVQRPQPQPKDTAPLPRPVKTTAPVKLPVKAPIKPVTPTATANKKEAIPALTKAPAAPASTQAPAQTVPQQPVQDAPTTAVAAADERTQQEQARLTLQQALARHFRYPLLARKRGWQGEVLLAFRLETDGRITDARIARSSGHGLLDRAALNALGKIKRIDHTLPQRHDMQLPVIYRLQEG